MDSVSKRLRDLREDNDLLQATMAQILGCNRTSVSNYENGRDVPMDVIIDYCKYFDISADWLLGLSTDRKRGGSKLNQQLDVLGELTAKAGGQPVTTDMLSSLLTLYSRYYASGAPAGNAPVDVAARLVSSLSTAVMATLTGPAQSVLIATNAVANAGLTSSAILAEYLTRHQATDADIDVSK